MLIVHERKRKEFVILFPTVDSFIEYLKINYSSLKFDSKIIEDKIKQAYSFFSITDEVIQYTRLTRNLHRGFSFKYKNVTKKEFWIERGWSNDESNNIIQKDKSERAIKQSNTRNIHNKDKDVLILNGSENEFRFISGIFYSINKPICNECNSDLTLKRVNVNNISDKFYYKIIGCSSDGCKTHNMEKNDKYLSFLPSDVATKTIGDIAKNIKEKNILSIDSWIQKGYSEEDAKREIFKIQSENSKKRLNPFKPTKENLKKYGYSEEKIKEICLSPTQEKFWINKGLSKEDAIVRIRELQKSNSLKFVQKRIENHGAYSAVTETQIGYWINKGMSEENANVKLRERQSTFSLERCIEKYGEEEGQIK